MKNRLYLMVLIVMGLVFSACSLVDSNSNSNSNSNNNSDGTITVTPSTVTLVRGETQQFTADQSWVTWSLEGTTGNSNISNGGLLTVGNDETASTLTVRAKKSYYNDGTARVTVASPSQTPSGLKVNKPGPDNIQLSWSSMSGVTQYTVQRSVNGKDFGTIGTASSTSYTDNAVLSGTSYYYRVQANGVNSNVIFVFAADYFNMPTFAQRKLIPLVNSGKHYYRFSVDIGQSYTIEWQNGNNQNTPRSFGVDAYQNNGTLIFSRPANYYSDATGYTNPSVFTATATGFVSIVIYNNTGDNQEYQIYCYGIDGTVDSGTVALPPYKVNAFRVSSPYQDSITLTWDAVSDGIKYNIYRANTQNGTPGKIGESNTTTYTDNQVPPGGSFWYTIAAVNADGREGCRFQGAFSFAASHYTLSLYSGAQTLSLTAGAKHYYRFAVTQGNSYTIEWQDGNNQNTPRSFGVDAYQNNGTLIFSRPANYYSDATGYTNPSVFTATATGFVTIEVYNNTGSSQNYQIYYY